VLVCEVLVLVLVFEKVDTENSIIRVLIHPHLDGSIVGIGQVNCAILGDDCADLAAVASLLRLLSRTYTLASCP
jgi:hypothetical protein